MDYAQEQADEIEALDSIYTGYFDKLTDAPPFKVSPGRMRPRSADDGVRSPQSSRARKHAITARRFSRVSRAARLHTCETAETRCERCGTVHALPLCTQSRPPPSWRRLTCVLA